MVLDIGSGSVAGALVRLSGNTPSILYSIRVPIAVQTKKTSGRLMEGMLKACEDVVKTLIHEACTLHAGKIHTATCFLSSPWYVSRVHLSRIERQDPITVTEHFLDDVISSEAKDFTVSLKEKEKEQILSGRVSLMEHKIFGVALNGYQVTNPYGKRARQIEVTSYLSLVSSDLRQKIEDIVHAFAHVSQLQFTSFPVALQSFVDSHFPHEEEYALFDITAEMTDMALVRDGKIVFVEAFAQGKNTLVRKVSEAFNIGPDLALSFIHLFAEKKMESDLNSRMEKIVSEVGDMWAKDFNDLIQNKESVLFPKKVFITTDEGVAKVFVQFLTKNSVLKGEGEVIVLGSNILSSLTHVRGGVVDPFLLVEGAFISDVGRVK